MKRSPYLSAMAIDNNESEDLVVALSRPGRVASVSPEGTGGGSGGGGGGAGGMGFFNLKRPGSWTGQQVQGLQRPQGQGVQGQGGLQLQRPQQQGQGQQQGITPVSSEGTTTTVGTEDHPTMSVDGSDDGNGGEGNAHFPSVAPSALKQTAGGATGGPNTGGGAARMPSLRSALRVNSSAQLQQSSQREGTTTTNNNNSGGGMKKNTSVTFSMNTKNPSRLGLQFANNNTNNEGAAGDTAAVGNNDAFPLFANNNPRASKDYSASGMMRKSQSICAPEYLLSHSPAGGSSVSGGNSGSAHSGGGGASGGGGEGNASFPVYFAKLGGQQSPQQQQQGLPPQPQLHQSNQEQIRRKSKSMNTLQYSYQNDELLSSSNSSNPNATNSNNACGNKLFGALGITPSSRVNLKFRDMLDEGDGNEGDLNLRLRNQQWKDFRMFSKEFESENPMLVSIEEGGASGSGGAAASTVADSGGAGGGATPMSTNVKPSTSSLSGSKRAISPSSTSGQTSSHSSSSKTAAAFMNSFGSHRQLNSHRASVSVNDLAMLRRSAARMRVGPSSSNNSSSSNRSFATTTTTTSPGATLGGEMLSRISSRNSIMSINSSTGSGGAGAGTENTLSPLAQMMAKSANLSSKQQQDLFLSKAKYQMSNDTTSSSAAAGMGRRVHTVGAGLAYGGPNLSRFDLGSLRKDLSIMSGGSGSSGAGKNEEWDL